MAVLNVYPLLAEGTCNCSTSSQDGSSCAASTGANCNSDNNDVITVSDYEAFLTAVASTSDPNSYYDETMAGDSTSPALIIRTEDPNGNYIYSVASGQENMPITLTQEEAAAYTDWCNNGQSSSSSATDTAEPTYRILNSCGCMYGTSCGCYPYCNCN